MRLAQHRSGALTLVAGGGFTDPDMRNAFVFVLVLIGLVLIPRAYVRAGG